MKPKEKARLATAPTLTSLMHESNTSRKAFKPKQEKLPVMKIHPLARKFKSQKEELEQFREDIEANGIKVPILVNKGRDTIYDGHQRWKIAWDLGFTLDKVPMDEFEGNEPEIRREILSRNVYRRHLSDDQRLAILTDSRATVGSRGASATIERSPKRS